VEAVLRGEKRYPAGLKVRRLVETMYGQGVGGVALGVRANESRRRREHVRIFGLNYQRRDGIRVCQPIAHWPAEMVIGAILRDGSLPLNPVYRKLSSAPESLERIRDGTWWPVCAQSQRGWIATYYPELLKQFDRAMRVGAAELEHMA
jgi:3'-phosphoadenosine 5'-phosphosulfate sulfotransferase (PAPS reductase)/FAD synthetase